MDSRTNCHEALKLDTTDRIYDERPSKNRAFNVWHKVCLKDCNRLSGPVIDCRRYAGCLGRMFDNKLHTTQYDSDRQDTANGLCILFRWSFGEKT